MGKYIIVLILVLVFVGLVAAGVSMADEDCHTVDQIAAAADANGLGYKVFSGSDLAAFELAVKAQGFKVPPGATRAMTADYVDGSTYFGFEIAGCLTGPFPLRAGRAV